MVSKSRPAAASASLSLFCQLMEKNLSNTKKKRFHARRTETEVFNFLSQTKQPF